MFERLVEQRVAICAVLHDVTVTKAKYKHLDLEEDQWELLSRMVTVLKPLQMATAVFSLEKNTSCSIINPVSMDSSSTIWLAQRVICQLSKDSNKLLLKSWSNALSSLVLIQQRAYLFFVLLLILDMLTCDSSAHSRERLHLMSSLAKWNLLRSKETRN